MVREYPIETLASPDAVLVIDETGFLKQGLRSCGVRCQYTYDRDMSQARQLWIVFSACTSTSRPRQGL
jgi:hypothetical protein